MSPFNVADGSLHNFHNRRSSTSPLLISESPVVTPRTPCRRALLISCSYCEAPRDELNFEPLPNSHKDVESLKTLLLAHNWNESDITILRENDPDVDLPTRENIMKRILELVNGAQDGDLLFFHFSGHGYQVPSTDRFEYDGKDEYILPSDYWKIKERLRKTSERDNIESFCKEAIVLDDDLRKMLVDPLPSGVRLYCLVDACHSGTIMDLPLAEGKCETSQTCAETPRYNPNGNITRHHNTRGVSRSTPPKARVLPRLTIRQSSLPVGKEFLSRQTDQPCPCAFSRPFIFPRPKASDNSTPPEDIRFINGTVVCFSSCQDHEVAFESLDGGLLVQAFCNILSETKRISVRELYKQISTRLSDLDVPDPDKPIPQLGYSCESIPNLEFSLFLDE